MARGSPAMTASPLNKGTFHQRAKQSARSIAFSVLLDVETKSAYASELLFSRLTDDLDPREAALATEITMGTLRWQRALDFLIERYTKRNISALDVEVLIALRLGIYQLRHLTRIPARAAVNESVELVRRVRKSSAAPLVNAALRRASAQRKQPLKGILPAELDAGEKMAIERSHPTWLVERWLRKFGQQKTAELLDWNNQAPSQSCAILDDSRRDEVICSIEEAGIETAAGRLLRDAILIRKGNVTKTAAFQNGSIAIQDEASQLIPLLLDVKSGNSVLDLCAAPGGKTLTLARNAGQTGSVIACDIHEARLRMMRQRFNTAGHSNISLLALDGTAPLPFSRKFDRILVDAPCSGTGTLARNPEIRWRLWPEDLGALHVRQVALLASALNSLSPNGKLLYSTCSLEIEENESVVNDALASNPAFRVEPLRVPQELLAKGATEELTDDSGAFRTFPSRQKTDGFFAVMICRK